MLRAYVAKVVFFGLVVHAGSLNAVEKDTAHFASINYLIEQEVGLILIPKIYQSVGIDVQISPLPAKRAQKLASRGVVDGEIMRIFSYGDETPTTIRVPTPYYYLETCAFTKKSAEIELPTASALRNYRLAKVRGVKHTNNITKGMPNVIDEDNTSQAMKLLAAGLADAVLTNRLDGEVTIEELGMKSKIELNHCFTKLDLFNYIHLRKASLVPIINAAILDLKRSGKLQQWITEAEQQVVKTRLAEATD